MIGFSAGAYIGKSNGVASPNPQLDGVGLAAIIDAIRLPRSSTSDSPFRTSPSLVPVATFYTNSIFGRTVYNVVPTSKIDSAFGNVGLKNMFKDPDGLTGPLKAAICDQTATIQTFGFLVTADCGNTTLKGSYIAASPTDPTLNSPTLIRKVRITSCNPNSSD